jgi:hypothetical protein
MRLAPNSANRFSRLSIAFLFCLRIFTSAFPASPPDHFILGTNFSGICDWGTEPVWKDLFKQSRTWCPQRPGMNWGEGWPLSVDSLNWVKKFDANQTCDVPLFSYGMVPESTYVCLFKGKGTVEIWNAANWSLASPGRIEFRCKPAASGGPFLQLKTNDSTDNVRDIRIFRRDHEAAYLSSPWQAGFLSRWKNFPVARFMDWMSTNNSPVRRWTERTRPNSQTQAMASGVAPEHMIDYCNKTLTCPWFCIPHLADDDYVTKFAQLVRDSLDPQLKVYVEYSNECWNSIFTQTHYCDSMGVLQGLGTNQQPWEAGWKYYGRRSKQIFAIWEQVFGGTDRLVRVIASQTNTYVTNLKLMQDSVYLKSDAVAIAPYFGGKFNDAARLADIATWPVDRLLDSCLADIRGDNKKAIQDHVTYVNSINTSKGTKIKLVAYEGGQHLSAWGQNQAATDLFTAANRNARMKDLYMEYLQQWADLGGTLFCNFSSMCQPGVYGAWCVLEEANQDPATSPKYQALLEMIKKYPPDLLGVSNHRVFPDQKSFCRILLRGNTIVVPGTTDALICIIRPNGAVSKQLLTRDGTGKDVLLGLGAGIYIVKVAAQNGVAGNVVIVHQR